MLRNLGTLAPHWVLPAEVGSGMILRLHETMGHRGTAILTTRDEPTSVTFVDFLEGELAVPEQLDSRSWKLEYRPHQVLGVKIS